MESCVNVEKLIVLFIFFCVCGEGGDIWRKYGIKKVVI